VAEVLELAQLLEHDGVPEVDVGGRRVHPELHPQRPPEPELGLQPARGQRLRGVAREVGGGLLGGVGHPGRW
jgi:hypothetical protein